MMVRYHEIPEELFGALAAGGGGPAGIRALAAAEHSKHVVLLHGILAAARGAGGEQVRLASLGWEVLAEAERRDPGAVASVTRYPAVGAWAVRTLRALDAGAGAPGAVPARLSSVAAAAAVRAGLDAEVPVLPVDGIVSLPALGAVRVGAAPAVVRSSAGRAEVRWAEGRAEIPWRARDDIPGWQGIRNCEAGRLRVAIDDLDPFRMPAVAGLAPRLTAVAARGWERILDAGWSVLAAGHPTVAAEAAEAISAIVPMSRSAHGQLSSSSPEAFGAVAMSEPADPAICAVTLTHEVQHLKLCAVLDIVRLTRQDDGRRYYAPWRADPRPVAGLLQGAYAYLGVTEFWRRQRQLAAGAAQLKAESEFSLWRAGTVRVMDTLLSSGSLTRAGTAFVQRMSETASAWVGEPVSTAARTMALRESRRHRDRWEQDNGPVPS
jgi:HEXXH motif-containing protein